MIQLPDPRAFPLRIETAHRPTVEHWQPCTPLHCIHEGRHFYHGSAFYQFIHVEGRGILVGVYNGTPEQSSDDVLFTVIRMLREHPLPIPSIERFLVPPYPL